MVTQRPVISICTQLVEGDVPGAVHNLIVSAKHLQELLQRWSVGQATEGQVSEAYVKIGTDFNATINAFLWHRIDLRYVRITPSTCAYGQGIDINHSDIHSVPKDLRTVLENCLSEEQSPGTLERYMPEVRAVLYRLLKGLQSRQDEWRAVGARVP